MSLLLLPASGTVGLVRRFARGSSAVLLAGLLGALASYPLAAQERGWLPPQRIVPGDAMARWRHDDARGGQASREASARELYDLAVGDLEDGRDSRARERFKSLVDRFPGTEAAERATKRLRDAQAAEINTIARTDQSVPMPAAEPVTRAPIETEVALPPVAATGRLSERQRAALSDTFTAKIGDRVFFSEGSAELGSRARMVLSAQAQWLARNALVDVLVEGHADETGTEDYNRKLAGARAEAVRRRLIEEGVAAERIETRALGRAQRISECPDAACAAQNRRAITALIGRTGAPRIGRAQTGREVPAPETVDVKALPVNGGDGITR